MRTIQQVNIGQITKHEAARVMRAGLSTVNRKIGVFRQHGWRGLVPGYKAPKKIPDTFVAYWKNMVEDNQRCTAAAWRELVRRWARRESIDGYEGHPGWPNLPRGWGKDGRNLYRHKGSKFELTAMRQGLGAATARHAPKVLTTRAGLWHLSHIAFDDLWLDMQTHLLTRQQKVRVLQIGALDLLSGCRFHYGTKPQIIRADGTKDSLKEADMRFALASVLYNHGISARGTTLLVEHGTAAIRGPLRDILYRGLGDKISIPDGGMTGKLQLIAGMNEGRGGGNPRTKSPLESLHNLIHNEFAALPGQTGHDRTEPEWLHGVEKECDWLWRMAKGLPPEVLQTLAFPTCEYYTQLLPAIHAMHEVINKRDWHELEGWADCGFLSTDYRFLPSSNEWISQQDFLALPPTTRHALSVIAAADPLCSRPRKLSPREVFQTGVNKGEIIKVPHGLIAEILYNDEARPRTVRDGYIKIEDSTIASQPMFFEGSITRPDGRQEELRDRETYDVVVNPFDPRAAWIFSATRSKGAFLGLAKQVQRVCKADADGIKHALGRQMERMDALSANQKGRHATASNGLSRRTLKRITHNVETLEKAHATQAEQSRIAAALLDTPSETSESEESTPTNTTNEHDPRNLFR